MEAHDINILRRIILLYNMTFFVCVWYHVLANVGNLEGSNINSSAEVKKTCIYTSTPPYAFMA
jgi:hypothetical protein